MRCVRFCARGVLVLALVLSISGAAHAFPRWIEDPGLRNPLIRLILKIVQISTGDGVIIPTP